MKYKSAHIFLLIVFVTVSACIMQVRAQEALHAPIVVTTDDGGKETKVVPDAPPLTQTIKIIKNISIDVTNIPKEDSVFIVEPIMLSLATDTLELLVHSSVYPDTYPHSLSSLFGDESTENRFNISHPEEINSSILSYYSNDPDGSDPGLKPVSLTPQGIGAVTLEFYGDVDLNLKKGYFKKKKIKHITIQVPIKVVE